LEDPGVDGRIKLKWILEKWDGDMDCIIMAQDRDRWRACLEEFYRLSCVRVWSRNLRNKAALVRVGLLRQRGGGEYKHINIYVYLNMYI
jgi:hypothetical protein